MGADHLEPHTHTHAHKGKEKIRKIYRGRGSKRDSERFVWEKRSS